MRISAVLVVVGTLLLTGCSSMMQPVENQAVQPSAQDGAQVVFMRSAFTAKAIDASL